MRYVPTILDPAWKETAPLKRMLIVTVLFNIKYLAAMEFKTGIRCNRTRYNGLFTLLNTDFRSDPDSGKQIFVPNMGTVTIRDQGFR